MRHRILAAVVALLAVAAVMFLYSLERRVTRSELILKRTSMRELSEVIIEHNGTTYVIPRGEGETAEAWAQRVRRIVTGEEDAQGSRCTTLTGCKLVNSHEAKVYTACQKGWTEERCDDAHAKEVEAICKALKCDC